MIFTLTKGLKDIKMARALRKKVFVEELGIPIEVEQDILDETAYHLVLIDHGEPIAVGRLIIQDNDTVIFGRIAVEKDFRGKGYGAQLLIKMIDRAKNEFGMKRAELHAQVNVVDFYEKYGFVSLGHRFTEAGIEHQGMILDDEGFKNFGV